MDEEGQTPPQDDYDSVMAKFDSHFIPKRNVTHERARFYARQQKTEKVKKELQRLKDAQIIEEVEEPTECENDDDHEVHLGEVHKKLRDANFRLRKEKCEYRKKEINFIGFRLSAEGISIDPSKVEAVTGMPDPENIHELRRFIGMVNFLAQMPQATDSEEFCSKNRKTAR
nr:hypothetical protein BaRGS_020992 [Batillaria attramentaria]